MLAKREVEAMNKSFEEDRAGRKCPVINPYESSIRSWESAIALMLLYQAIEIPLRLSFESVLYDEVGLLVCRWIELLMDVVFMVDVALNFFISYVDNDMQMITDHALIAREYLRSWFVIDLLGGFPIDWCFPATWGGLTSTHTEATDSVAASGVGLLKTVKLSKLFKMFKLVKLGFRILRLARRSRSRRYFLASASNLVERAWESMTSWIHPYAWTVMKQLVLFFFLVHLFACVQFAMSDGEAFFPECAGMSDERSCWPYRAHLLFSNVSDAHEMGRPPPDGLTLYIASFFHTSLQMLNGEVGLGGDPEFAHEYVLVFLSSLVGFFWQALIVASLAAFIEHVGRSGKAYRDNIDRLRQYAKRHKLPHELRERLFLYYQVRYPDGRYFDDRSVTDDLSRPLMLEIREHNCQRVLEHLKIRRGTRLSHFLAEHLTYRTFVNNAVIIQQGYPPRSMFFILSGSVEVVIEHDDGSTSSRTTLTDGQIFGESSLLTKQPAPFSYVVRDLLEAFELHSEAFDEICGFDENFRTMIENGVDVRMCESPGMTGNVLWKAIAKAGSQKDLLRATKGTSGTDSPDSKGHRMWTALRHARKVKVPRHTLQSMTQAVSAMRSPSSKQESGDLDSNQSSDVSSAAAYSSRRPTNDSPSLRRPTSDSSDSLSGKTMSGRL